MSVRCCCLVVASLGLLGGCASSAITLSSGVVHVSFPSDETCGFSNPYTVEARGCRRLDEKAVMCKGFGVIDGVLFAGGCEAPAELEVLETQGTMPLSSARNQPAADEAPSTTRGEPEASEPPEASDEPTPKVDSKVAAQKPRSSKGASSKKTKTKKAAAKRKKRPE